VASEATRHQQEVADTTLMGGLVHHLVKANFGVNCEAETIIGLQDHRHHRVEVIEVAMSTEPRVVGITMTVANVAGVGHDPHMGDVMVIDTESEVPALDPAMPTGMPNFKFLVETLEMFLTFRLS
jgi:hypothetical protein